MHDLVAGLANSIKVSMLPSKGDEERYARLSVTHCRLV
jgi:hypothetical protein